MRRSLALGALLCASLAPSFAAAKAVEEVTFGNDGADLIVTVFSDEALNTPAVRTYSGQVRVRFYDAHELPLLKLEGDGSAVRGLELTRGSDKSAALTINLGDKTRLSPSDVRVERDGEKTMLRIARGLLPAIAGAPAQAPAVKAQPKAAAPTPAEKVALAAPEAQTPAAQPQPEAQKPAPLLGTKKAEEKKTPIKLAEDSGSSPFPVLIAMSALLAVAYGALKLFMQKKTQTENIPSINVVAQKRLGPRHQLVIVRAFDRDYLLSIQGGQTTVVARSTRTRRAAQTDSLASISSNSNAPAGRDFEDDEVTFGGELFKQALEERERVREHTLSYKSEQQREPTLGHRLENARVLARAELAAIEESKSVRVENDVSRDAGVVEPSPTAISESVSGLLRLRRKVGR